MWIIEPRTCGIAAIYSQTRGLGVDKDTLMQMLLRTVALMIKVIILLRMTIAVWELIGFP